MTDAILLAVFVTVHAVLLSDVLAGIDAALDALLGAGADE
jgi:hypothetical protein